MTHDPRIPFRIYQADSSEMDGTASSTSLVDAETLTGQELLRLGRSRPGHRELEPFSRSWFEELEAKRFAGANGWLRQVLEFTRHGNETMAMIGPGLGTDAIQYQRHGTDVTICASPTDPVEAIRRNFELRGRSCRVIHTGPEFTLPFEANTLDLAYLNLVFHPPAPLERAIAEVYRILKPGGKVFVLAPAKFDVGYWERILLPYRAWYRTPPEFTTAGKHSRLSLRSLLDQFEERRFSKRLLRRAELPYLWRFVPLSVLERLVGRVVAMRAFKPVSAALQAKSWTEAA